MLWQLQYFCVKDFDRRFDILRGDLLFDEKLAAMQKLSSRDN